MNSLLSKQLEIILEDIICELLINAKLLKEIGLFEGKMGIAIFLYNYSKCYNNTASRELADSLIDDILDEDQIINFNYFDGLTGIGSGFLYLSKNNFIEVDANILLSDIDDVVYDLISSSKTNSYDMLFGLTGIGKYCVHRFYSRKQNYAETNIAIHEACICQIVDSLVEQYNTLSDILGVIDFISDVISHKVNCKKGTFYLKYALNKLETRLFEDHHFQTINHANNILQILSILAEAHFRTKIPEIKCLYRRLLQLYNLDINKESSHFEECIRELLLNDALLYKNLNWRFPNASLVKEAEKCLTGFFSIEHFSTFDSANGRDLGIASGCAGTGLKLLSVFNCINFDWLRYLSGYQLLSNPMIKYEIK